LISFCAIRSLDALDRRGGFHATPLERKIQAADFCWVAAEAGRSESREI
jgi:hypothetical protein